MKRKQKGLGILALVILVFAGIRTKGEGPSLPEMDPSRASTAILAGGCFWCVEADFEKLEGVIEVVSGYTGGHVENPSYKAVSAGKTGHVEAVKVLYDPERVTYTRLLDHFWRHIDPTDSGGQFVDRGAQYRPVIYYRNEEEKRLAEESREKLLHSGVFKRPIATEIAPAQAFYEAEEYHQDYSKKNPLRYRYYRFNSGRDQFLEKTWKGR